MKVNKKALIILQQLNKAGFDAFVVGGCVRDSLLGKEPKDWDITTNAKTDEIMQVFKGFDIIPTGIQHGTVTVLIDKEGFEVTTYRIDGDYSDGRHPDNVKFTNSLKDDLSRRDFTINAMAYNENEGLIDFFGGKQDLKNKVIKCVGKAEDRFEEDALRVLRALRFASVLSFEIEEKTSKAIFDKAKNLDKVSKERINVEFVKILNGKGVLHILSKYRDVFGIIIPELVSMFDFKQNNRFHDFDVWGHTIRVVESCKSENTMLRVAALFHDIGKPETYTEKDGIGHFYGHPEVSVMKTEKIMRDLKFSTVELELVLNLIRFHDVSFSPTKKFVLKMLNKIGEDKFRLLIKLREGDLKGQTANIPNDDRFDRLYRTLEVLDSLELKNECFNLKHLAVNGSDLIKMGYKQGKELGEILNNLLQLVIDCEVENKKEELLKYVK